jgi:hypothetical protein
MRVKEFNLDLSTHEYKREVIVMICKSSSHSDRLILIDRKNSKEQNKFSE